MSYLETEYEFFLAHGFSPAQSAGIVGNLQQESGGNPEAVQSGGPGRGIAQWSVGGRWVPGLMTGNPSTDLQNQLNYILQELETNPGYGLGALESSTSPTQAAQVFGSDYEKYGVEGGRVSDAQNIYNEAMAGWPNTVTGSSVPVSAGLTSATSPGASLTGFNPLGSVSGDIFSGFLKDVFPTGMVTRIAITIIGVALLIVAAAHISDSKGPTDIMVQAPNDVKSGASSLNKRMGSRSSSSTPFAQDG